MDELINLDDLEVFEHAVSFFIIYSPPTKTYYLGGRSFSGNIQHAKHYKSMGNVRKALSHMASARAFLKHYLPLQIIQFHATGQIIQEIYDDGEK